MSTITAQARSLDERLVLYIEDDPIQVQLMREVMSFHIATRLIATASGEAGLALACSERPDLILLDYSLPDLTGGEVLEQLRRDPRTSSIAVIIISADATLETRQRLQHLRPDAHLTKPFVVAELLALADRLLEEV